MTNDQHAGFAVAVARNRLLVSLQNPDGLPILRRSVTAVLFSRHL
jgi:hypothetical protein